MGQLSPEEIEAFCKSARAAWSKHWEWCKCEKCHPPKEKAK